MSLLSIQALSQNKNKILYSLALLAIGASLGFLGKPTKVVTKTIVKEIEKKQEKKKNDTVTKIIEKINKDGSKTTETVIVDKGTTDTTTEKTTDKRTEKVVDYSGKWQAKLLAARQFDGGANSSLIFGAAVERKLFGPLSVGVFGLTNTTIGVSLGMGF